MTLREARRRLLAMQATNRADAEALNVALTAIGREVELASMRTEFGTLYDELCHVFEDFTNCLPTDKAELFEDAVEAVKPMEVE